MNKTALWIGFQVGTPRHRRHAAWQLATIRRRRAEERLDHSARALQRRGQAVASALHNQTMIERALDELLVGRTPPSVAGEGRPMSSDELSDLLGMADHDLRVARTRRADAAQRVTRRQLALESAIRDERHALDRYRTTTVLAGSR